MVSYGMVSKGMKVDKLNVKIDDLLVVVRKGIYEFAVKSYTSKTCINKDLHNKETVVKNYVKCFYDDEIVELDKDCYIADKDCIMWKIARGYKNELRDSITVAQAKFMNEKFVLGQIMNQDKTK